VGSQLPAVIGVVIAAAFLLLLATFRSPLLAFKAAAANLLSIGASYGVLVAVFQWGWGWGWTRTLDNHASAASGQLVDPALVGPGAAAPGTRGSAGQDPVSSSAWWVGLARPARVSSSSIPPILRRMSPEIRRDCRVARSRYGVGR